jgi:hypothetical protein
MKHTLLLVVLGMLACVPPAHGQYVYLDVNGDGLSYERESMVGNQVPVDVLNPTVTAIDVWFVTHQKADGSAVECLLDPGLDYSLKGYQAILRYSGIGTVTFHGWTDILDFGVGNITAGDGSFATSGTDAWFGRYGGPTDWLPSGAIKVGTVSVTVTGTPSVIFAMSSTIHGNAETSFNSDCIGARFDNTIRLGPTGDPEYDFYESFGALQTNPVVPTTWGKIKERYR